MEFYNDHVLFELCFRGAESLEVGYWFSSEICAYAMYEGWNFNSGNYLFTTDTK